MGCIFLEAIFLPPPPLPELHETSTIEITEMGYQNQISDTRHCTQAGLQDVHVAMQTTKIASLLADIYSETCENSLLGMNSLEYKVSLLKRTLGSFVCVLPILYVLSIL